MTETRWASIPVAAIAPGGPSAAIVHQRSPAQIGQLSLADLPLGAASTVVAIGAVTLAEDRDLVLRLVELGFVPGERVRVVAHGHPGHEPIAVRLGGTTFALRRFEAEYILVEPLAANSSTM